MRYGAGRLDLSHFDAGASLASNDICFVSYDSRGWVWVGTDNGLDIFNGRQWRHIGSRDGLIWHDTVFNAFAEDADGAVWIGTNRGLSRFIPRKEMFDRPPPSIAITGVSFGGKETDEHAAMDVPYASRSLRIGFSTLSFSQVGEVRFRYRLKGLDQHWLETPEREAVFPNLAPGR